LDEENPKSASLTQENGFGPTKLHGLPWLVEGAAAL
jgi:hypothetical protein